ncbi:MAG: tetratricopeptide repeat protein, partial [Myxococcota bacterium]
MPLAALFVALGVLLVYGQTLGHGFLLLDDDVYVTNNPQVLQGLRWEGARWAFAAPRSANYHPLTYLSHMLDTQLFGGASAGPRHGMSVFLHALASVVLFLALRALAGGFWTPLVATLLFALHPLRVESVAWIAERKDVLSGLFSFAALLVYASVARRGGALRHLLLIGLFAAGLLSKSMVVTLPFVLLLLDFWPLGRVQGLSGWEGAGPAPRPARPVALVVEKLPFFALSLALGLVTVLAQEEMGAVRSELPLAGRIANALAAYGGYLVSFAFPARLAIFYPHPVILDGGVTGPLLLRAILSAAALLAISVLCWRARQRAPHLLLGWLWFVGMLVP